MLQYIQYITIQYIQASIPQFQLSFDAVNKYYISNLVIWFTNEVNLICLQ